MRSSPMLIKTAWRGLSRNLRRTLTVALTVASGAASLFVFDGFNAGVMNQYRANTIRSRFGYGQLNTQGYREQVFEKPWQHWIEDGDAVVEQARHLPGVTDVFPRMEFFALLTNGNVTISGRGQGVDGPHEAAFFTTLNVEEGTTLSSQPDGILLGRGLARALKAKPGDRITVLSNTIGGTFNGVDLKVTGIFHTGSKDFDDVVFRVPLAQARKLLDTDRIENIAIALDRLESWPLFARAAKERFPQLEAVPFAVLDEVYYQHAVDWLGSQFRVIELIILAVVMLGIFNSVSTGVLERKREIGTLRANGESSWDVLKLLCMEGALLGALSAVVGIFVAWLLNSTVLAGGILMPASPGITRQFHVWIELQPLMAVKTLALAMLCALAGTWLAGWRVARMPIAEALRSI